MTEEKSKILLKDFVVFLSTWGTGKTELMVKKAKKLSKKGEKVLLVIITFGRNSSLPTLLVHQLQNTFLKNEHIDVLHVPYIDGTIHNGFQESAKNYDHILIDEFFGDFLSLSKCNQEEFLSIISNKKTVWITMSNTYWLTMKTDLNQLTNDVNNHWFPMYNFETVTMTEAQRFSAEVGVHFKVLLDQIYGPQMPLNALLFMQATPSSLASKVSTISPELVFDLKTCLKACLSELVMNKNDQNFMIMIEDLPNDIKALVKNQEILPLIFDQLFKDLGLECPKYCTETFSNIDDIEETKNCAIVTTYSMAKGVEHRNIINLSGPLCHSRSCGNIVNAPANFNMAFLALPWVDASFDSMTLLEWIDTKLDSFGYNSKRSTVFLNYFHKHNPLIECILDCIKDDEDLEDLDPESITKLIYQHLQSSTKSDCPFDSAEDILNFRIWEDLAMKKKLQKYEDEIISACCKILKRKIVLIPILDTFLEETFGAEHLKDFKIFCLRNFGRLGRFNFYISTKKK